MKNTWGSPRIVVEQFAPNEYVAACWKVACSNDTTFYKNETNSPYGNHWSRDEGPYDRGFSHGGDCAVAGNNYFQANGANIVFEYENSSAQGNLTGGFDYWVDVNGNGKVDTNDVVYWYTDNGSRRWNHWGYVESVDAAHVGRS